MSISVTNTRDGARFMLDGEASAEEFALLLDHHRAIEDIGLAMDLEYSVRINREKTGSGGDTIVLEVLGTDGDVMHDGGAATWSGRRIAGPPQVLRTANCALKVPGMRVCKPGKPISLYLPAAGAELLKLL